MTLSERIRSSRELMVQRWEEHVLHDPGVPEASRLPEPVLRDHVPEILVQIADALEASPGSASASAGSMGRTLGQQFLPKQHAKQRAEYGYSIAAALRELSHLRTAVVEVCGHEGGGDPDGIHVIHVALDECMSVAAVEMERLATARLTDVATHLREEGEIRERFLAFLSHDLRNPLSTITMAASTLLTRGLVEREAGLVRRISRATDRMARMIADLLDFTRVRAGKIPIVLRQGDLRAICQEVIDDFKLVHPERRIDFQPPHGNVFGLWDNECIAQVLANLVGNALAYSPADAIDEGLVTIAIHDSGTEVVLTVHNGGPSIPAVDLPRLFTAFHRGNVDANRSGLGLGLYIAKEIVEAHGGRIWVDSSDEKGTTFFAAFPQASTLSAPAMTPDGSSDGPNNSPGVPPETGVRPLTKPDGTSDVAASSRRQVGHVVHPA